MRINDIHSVMRRRKMLRNMEPLCEGDHLRVFVDGAVQASITLGAVVQPSFGPNGTYAKTCNPQTQY